MTGMEKPRDVVGGLLVVAIGAGFFLFGRELEMGSSFRMGPGYFPTILSVLMILLGVAMVALAWRKPTTEGAFGSIPWLGIILVVFPVVFFGLTLRGLGLAPVLVIVVLLTAWASRYRSVRTAVPLALGLAAFCSLPVHPRFGPAPADGRPMAEYELLVAAAGCGSRSHACASRAGAIGGRPWN